MYKVLRYINQMFHKYLSDPYNHDTIISYKFHPGKDYMRNSSDILKDTLLDVFPVTIIEVLSCESKRNQIIKDNYKKGALLDTALISRFSCLCIYF